ncbi:DNA-3-methyladenine glycosylase [Schinkia azotoformans MEV2011]|uniref:Putative 3-methyladenine DNA glycosylase n=1 Tax=Schinkia azotoformans MEV2011 TaxID=1348973 RepID=A0A072NH76_SCHAZ|nr:DNA-3-methyladenine glycosylase [Schinkia azotoformans]KEF36886.1 DNA-3-methyladenine glycosylase [Schinkia azotoformans MEV2011]MEC1695260.1 DNA-3-methyladenine glycosylase [Schinkia azotoformans]MEC1717562.1 DNA-3-methyladenine glycosylase [Schinkia azotoformans]MEC1723717.1 DNA-3-methyladenine glycosylase [Schinkia azotoformans]MEC1742488.1 DNA-3-methyladenine glycosylase [Schinkia azotoformans]
MDGELVLQNYKAKDNDFFEVPTLELARNLLGCLLVKNTDEGVAAGYIVETEAYIGPKDRAAHSYGGRRTKRTEIMFHQAGLAYTYQMHTHCLVNVVSGKIDAPEAILIRAIEPYHGIELMKTRRQMGHSIQLTNGPGKLTKALGIGMKDYGHSFMEPPLLIADGFVPDAYAVEQGKRIGIENTGEAKDYPWRFWIKDNPYVSKRPKK